MMISEPTNGDGWTWPVEIEGYEQTPQLTPAEQAALQVVAARCSAGRREWFTPATLPDLHRLLAPIDDVLDVASASKQARRETVRVIAIEMHYRARSYWGWTSEEWADIIGKQSDYSKPLYKQARAHRGCLFYVAYLLCGFTDFRVGKVKASVVAARLFTTAKVDEQVQRVDDELRRMGYVTASYHDILYRTICKILLVNRNPDLAALNHENLGTIYQQFLLPHEEQVAINVSRALVQLGVLDRVLSPKTSRSKRMDRLQLTRGVSDNWIAWCERWYGTSTLTPRYRRDVYRDVLHAGRWLSHVYPDIRSPEQWTHDLAGEYVAAINTMKVGECRDTRRIRTDKIGTPLADSTKGRLVQSLRRFFLDCQAWGWITYRFDPHRYLVFRHSRDTGANVRTIRDDVWAKLLWAGLNLQANDLPDQDVTPHGRRGSVQYPLEMVQAIAIVWLFCGLRKDEIHRLSVDCIRWEQRTERVVGGQEGSSHGMTCWLDVPANKTKQAFTKPVDYVVGDAIERWRQVRPPQPQSVDPKTGEDVEYLFSYNCLPLKHHYSNGTLIPLLCDKAGIPVEDARGRITSHRARSTIATQLINSQSGFSVYELKQWLGHNSLASTIQYVETPVTALGKAFDDAGYLSRNMRMIEVLIDQEAIRSGAVAEGEPWRYYDLGHGYCTYDFFDQCPHRMACARCSFYVPKQSSTAHLLESKADLERMLQEIPLTDDERLAIEGDVEAITSLYAKLTHIPAPDGTSLGVSRNFSDNGNGE